MFDFAWSEIALIGVVALIAIGPKDMPAAIRTITGLIKKARRMAAEFQTHVDEMVREAELGDVKKTFSDLRNLNVASALERAVDPDQSLRNTFNENPFEPTYPRASEVSTLDEVAVGASAAEPASADPLAPATPDQEPSTHAAALRPDAPDWLPPHLIPPPQIEEAVKPPEPPAWIPPSIAQQRRPQA